MYFPPYGNGSKNEILGDLIFDPTVGLAVIGYTNSYGNGDQDVLFGRFGEIRSGSSGYDIDYCQTFGGNEDDYAYSLIYLNDGNYIFAGKTKSSGAGGFDLWLHKFTANKDDSHYCTNRNSTNNTNNTEITGFTLDAFIFIVGILTIVVNMKRIKKN